jgi:hypothetical protein
MLATRTLWWRGGCDAQWSSPLPSDCPISDQLPFSRRRWTLTARRAVLSGSWMSGYHVFQQSLEGASSGKWAVSRRESLGAAAP